jgi:threonyl-tRNA synthetase
MLVVGNKEVDADSVSVRVRGGVDLGSMSVSDFTALIERDIAEKALTPPALETSTV